MLYLEITVALKLEKTDGLKGGDPPPPKKKQMVSAVEAKSFKVPCLCVLYKNMWISCKIEKLKNIWGILGLFSYVTAYLAFSCVVIQPLVITRPVYTWVNYWVRIILSKS